VLKSNQLSLRIQQLDVVCETKTKDNVFIQVNVAVQYRVVQDAAYEAFYRLTDPRGQIQSYVFDVVRSTIPKLELDEAFTSKDDIAEAVLKQLQDVMKVCTAKFSRVSTQFVSSLGSRVSFLDLIRSTINRNTDTRFATLL